MAQSFIVEMRGALLVFGLGVLLLPALTLCAAALLVHSVYEGGNPAQIAGAVLLGGVGGYFIFATLRELRGAWGIRIDDSGIEAAQLPGGRLDWSDVQRLEPLSFGVWRVHGPNASLRVSAYLFGSRDKLVRLMKKRVGN